MAKKIKDLFIKVKIHASRSSWYNSLVNKLKVLAQEYKICKKYNIWMRLKTAIYNMIIVNYRYSLDKKGII